MSQVNIVRALQKFFANMHDMCLQISQSLEHTGGDHFEDHFEESSHQSQGSTNTKAKRVKKMRDPLAPKKPISSFFFFFRQKREKIIKQFPELKNHEITKKVAETWNALPKDKREAFEKQAADDKNRYELEMKLYKDKAPVQDVKGNKKYAEAQQPEDFDSYGEVVPQKKLKK